MHDFENNYKTLESLRDIIKYGKEHGYTFKKIEQNTYPIRHGVNN
jgi:peptidoglycan/xylan/chitin deacetylase (PgdA/CDA1 family)